MVIYGNTRHEAIGSKPTYDQLGRDTNNGQQPSLCFLNRNLISDSGTDGDKSILSLTGLAARISVQEGSLEISDLTDRLCVRIRNQVYQVIDDFYISEPTIDGNFDGVIVAVMDTGSILRGLILKESLENRFERVGVFQLFNDFEGFKQKTVMII